jgi:hypothetical protein
MSASRPLSPQQRRETGHCGTSHLCQSETSGAASSHTLTLDYGLCGALNPHIDLIAERYKIDRLGQQRLSAILQRCAFRIASP